MLHALGQVVLDTLDLNAETRSPGHVPAAHLCAVAADTPITPLTGVKHRTRSWSRIDERDVGHLGMPAR